MCLYISRYIFNVSCLTCLTCAMLDMLNASVVLSQSFSSWCSTCLTCHVISLDSINLITSDYNDHVYYSSQLIISLQTFYQDWSSQEYSCYWENKIMQLTLNQSVQIIFKSVFKFASESVSESVYELIYESASEFVIKFVE